MRRPLATLLAPAVLAGMLAGCGQESPVAPQAAVSDLERGAVPLKTAEPLPDMKRGLFYPLTIGNHWEFTRHVSVVAVPAGQPPVPQSDFSFARSTELMCVEPAGEASYVIEQTTETGEGETSQWWVRYRQDRRGLYEADVSINTSPQCASAVRPDLPPVKRPDALSSIRITGIADPVRRASFERALASLRERAALIQRLGPAPAAGDRPGVRPGELTRLQYPLVPGQRWIIRGDPDVTFRAMDVGLIQLDTPAGAILAHRVRITSNVFGPRDQVVFYFSRKGLVGYRVALISEGTDENGNPTGSMLWNERMDLQSLTLVNEPAL